MSRSFSKKPLESSTKPPVEARGRTPRAAHDRTAGIARDASVIGNRAFGDLLQEPGADAGKPLPDGLRSRIEQSYGADLSAVRVRDDAAAWQAAQSKDAVAFAHGTEIYLGPDAPALNTPEAEPLLAHEAAHIVQQREAGVIEDRVSAPGEVSETQASTAAHQALAGRSAQPSSAGASVAATQRESKLATREEAEQALLAYLNRLKTAQPGVVLRTSPQVRNALGTLAQATPIDLTRFMLGAPENPAAFAKAFAKILPPGIDRGGIERLAKLTVAAKDDSTVVSRVGDLVKGSKAGGPEEQQEPGYVSPADQADRFGTTMRQLHNQPEPSKIGPAAVDVLQIARILKGLPGAIKPSKPKAPPPSGQNYPAVEKAIAGISPDALVPAEFRGKPEAGNYPDAQEFARDLARQMDVAQQRKQDTVTVDIGDYSGVKNRAAIRAAAEDIIAKLRDALPHHATEVTNVDVKTGKTFLTRGRARPAP